MSTILLTTDLHLTDAPLEVYRWKIFDTLIELYFEYLIDHYFFLGDVFDRKDRHTGLLVNKVVEHFLALHDKTNAGIYLLSGNHDKPLTGPYFWEFINQVDVHYITKPELVDEIYLLPFSPNPIEDWKNLDFSLAKAIFMHQTGEGATVEGGRLLESHKLPKLPKLPTYSGDVHRPQTANGITYIGTPHPIKFSETWSNRVLLLDTTDMSKYLEIPVYSIRRAILDISSYEELQKLNYTEGDQLRIRVKLAADNLTSWANEEQKIRLWAQEKSITLASLEAVLVGEGVKKETAKSTQLELMKPSEVVRLFSKQENLDEETINMGIKLIEESK